MPVPSPRTAPEALRLARATEAAAKLDVAIYGIPGSAMQFHVDSFKTDAKGQRISRRYVVDMAAYTCSCPDFQERGSYCKHLLHLGALCNQAALDIEADFQARQAVEQEDGRLYMESLHAERSLSC